MERDIILFIYISILVFFEILIILIRIINSKYYWSKVKTVFTQRSKFTKVVIILLAVSTYIIYAKYSDTLGNEFLAYLDDSKHPLQNFFNLHAILIAFSFIYYETSIFELPRRRYCIVDKKDGKILSFTKPYSEQSNSWLLQSTVVRSLLFYLERIKICKPFFKDYSIEESEYKEGFKGITFVSHENNVSQ